jgi:predicted alpha/beta-hydrolase family hydrolase
VTGAKSPGGRDASMVAHARHAAGAVAGLLCLGYPFHPPGKPAQLRTRHLAGLATPALICQGTRDPFGGRDEVAGYALSDRIELLWLEDGDHDLKPRKAITGLTVRDHLRTVAAAAAAWARRLAA